MFSFFLLSHITELEIGQFVVFFLLVCSRGKKSRVLRTAEALNASLEQLKNNILHSAFHNEMDNKAMGDSIRLIEFPAQTHPTYNVVRGARVSPVCLKPFILDLFAK